MINKIKTIALLIVLVISTVLTGCGNKEEITIPYETPEYLKNLTNGTYYILHKDKTVEPLYIGEATFNTSSSNEYADYQRVAWFKKDFDQIPTMYPGDKLIYFSNNTLTESFVFERFKFYGYTVGICHLKRTRSGRYAMSTNTNEYSTYPRGDTDVILNIKNESVVVDSIGGYELRDPFNDEYKIMTEEDYDLLPITRSGTIKGLSKDIEYTVDVYEGTIKHEFKFTADVVAMGSFECVTTTDFSFECESVINIGIPEYFNAGYYMVNSGGIFRYMKDNVQLADNIDFNTPNVKPEDNEELLRDLDDEEKKRAIEEAKKPVEGTGNSKEAESYLPQSTIPKPVEYEFEIIDPGLVKVSVEITDEAGNHIEDTSEIKGLVAFPSLNRNLILAYTDDGNLELSFVANELGVYTVKIYYLDNYLAHISIE